MIGFGIGPVWPAQKASTPFVRQPFVVGIFGQSQPNYMLDQGAFYRQIAAPAPGNGNLIAYTQSLPAGIVKTTVDAASVAAGQVNPVLAAWSAFFARILPAREIVIVDLCEGGTGRGQLMNDADAGRNWSDFAAMVARVRQDYDDIDLIVECWMANDAGTAKTMGPEWAPLYIGQRWGGGAFTLGTANPDSVVNAGTPVDHCLWDIEAPVTQAGRGLFKRAVTKWSVVGWPTFNARDDQDPEILNFTDAAGYPTTVDRPARDSLSTMFQDPRFQSFAVHDGFSSHIARMTDGGTAASTHPSVLSPDGQILMGWPYAAAIAKGTGHSIAEPQITGIEGAPDGSYADILVDLPNGGQLSTLRETRAQVARTPAKEDVQALYYDPARTGCRVQDAALKVPGVDALPAGLTWLAGARTVYLPQGVSAAALHGWDLRNVYLDLRGSLPGGIVDCQISSRSTQTTSCVIDIFATADIGPIEWNTIRGEGYLNLDLNMVINERFEENGVGPTVARITRNAFYSFPKDCIKAASAGEICLNYFDVPAALKNVPADHAAGTTYALHDAVVFGGLEYVSLTEGNTGNTPSGTASDTAFWKYADPHSDIINPRAVIGGTLEIWGNFINMAYDQRRISDAGEPWGMNNALRMTRNTGSTVAHGEVNAHHNIISTQGPVPAVAGHQVTYPVALGPNGNQTNWTPNRLENNWISQGANGRFTYEADPAPNVVAGNVPYEATAESDPNIAPHQQLVTGFEVARSGGARRPVFRHNQTGYPAAHRGSAIITDTGSGSPRQGRVRITPEVPFAFGDVVEYLRGDAGAILLEDRDADANLWADMLIEHVPALYDAAATYPMEGVPVRPQPAALAAPVPAPLFTPRGAAFDGASYYKSTSASVPATQQGILSFWMRNTQPTWEFLYYIAEARFGSTQGLEVRTNASGQMRVDLGTSAVSFYAGPTSGDAFVVGQWYHILMAWDGTACTVYVNDTLATTATITPADMGGQVLTQFTMGARLAGTRSWIGDLAHAYLNLDETLDLSLAANRAKFASAGSPVHLGAGGALPTGSAPAFYYDGDVPAWANQGTAGGYPLTGALTASGAPQY